MPGAVPVLYNGHPEVLVAIQANKRFEVFGCRPIAASFGAVLHPMQQFVGEPESGASLGHI